MARSALDAFTRDIWRRFDHADLGPLRLITGVQWFAETSEGVHGITERGLAGMRLLAVWCALAILVGDQIAPDAREVLVGPFRRIIG